MQIILGSLLCILAGACVGTFLLPLKFSGNWKWENSWLVGTLFMYVVFPLLTLRFVVPDFSRIYAETPARDLAMIYLFGLIQGTGSFVFTYGITLMGLALGYTLMIGAISLVSLLVPLFGAHPDRLAKIDGLALLAGCAVLVVGIAMAGRAGLLREREAGTMAAGAGGEGGTSAASRQDSRPRLRPGLAAAMIVWAGIANSLFYFTFEFQHAMRDVAIQKFGVAPHFWGFLNILPFFLGMFTVNLVLTLSRMAKDRSLANYVSAPGLGREYSLAFAIGLLWYLGQGVCYTAGHTLLGPLGVAVGAGLFMGTMMVVSNLAGVRTGEWKSATPRTLRLLYGSLVVLIAAMTIIAVGNFLQQNLAA